MSDTSEALARQIDGAKDLRSVVRTMKALAAASIGQYEQSVLALADYDRAVELGLSACFRDPISGALPPVGLGTKVGVLGAIVFGSDQGLVGQFNDVLTEFVVAELAKQPEKPRVWAVGERIHARLVDAGFAPEGPYAVPNSVEAITALVGTLQIACEAHHIGGGRGPVHVFHNQPRPGSLYECVSRRLLPLDAAWRNGLAKTAWPTNNLPEVLGAENSTLRALISGYLFIALFRACAESLASENASRLAGMQRADRNIDELLEHLQSDFHLLRQNSIDEELFDVIAGFNSLEGR